MDYDFNALLEWRAERDREFREGYSSPIPEEHLAAGFVGLHYFDPDPVLAVTGPLSRKEGRVEITASTGTTSKYRVAGEITVDVRGRTRSLLVFHGEESELYIPFRDGTCGMESYGGGRYAPVVEEGDTASVDFNRAVNPLCAYDEEFSCPLPPRQNWLPMRIEAGEQDYRSPRR